MASPGTMVAQAHRRWCRDARERRCHLYRRAAEPQPGVRSARRPAPALRPGQDHGAAAHGRHARRRRPARARHRFRSRPTRPSAHWSAGGGGKPDLKPWRAKSVDLSLEKYFQKRSYVAVAGFLKKLDSFIYQRSTERDFTGFPNYNPALTPGCAPIEPDCNPNIGTITTQDNGSGGKVYGVEVSVSLDGGLFTPALDGFGVILSECENVQQPAG